MIFSVSDIQSNIRKSSDTFKKLENLLNIDNERFKEFNSTLPSKLQKLRDEIAKARHIADGVSSFDQIFF